MKPRALAVFLLAGFAAAAAQADPAAWRVASSDGGELWLLGSMHYLQESDYPLPASVNRLFEEADGLVMELDLDDLAPAAEQRVLLGAAVLSPGIVLADVLGAASYERAARQAAALGVDLALLERFEPWFVAITLLDRGMRERGFLPEHGLEQHLLGRARQARKEILGLETMELQVGVFDALPVDEQRGLLEQTLLELEKPASAIDELADAWRAGELEKLAARLEAEFEGFPQLYRALVTERNERWIPELERLLAEPRRRLVVVGALHLVGRGSVIERLERRGHTVTRIPPQ